MRDKLYRFMQGRNGMDELARMQSWLVLILLLVGMFTRIGLFSFVALILMIYMYFRVFSRNTSKRYEENQKYLNFRYNRTVSWDRQGITAFSSARCVNRKSVCRGDMER